MFGTALISTTLSMCGLAEAAGGVECKLLCGGLEEARALVGHFVGRDTDGLSEIEVCRAAVESVAENASDGAWPLVASFSPLHIYVAPQHLGLTLMHRPRPRGDSGSVEPGQCRILHPH